MCRASEPRNLGWPKLAARSKKSSKRSPGLHFSVDLLLVDAVHGGVVGLVHKLTLAYTLQSLFGLATFTYGVSDKVTSA